MYSNIYDTSSYTRASYKHNIAVVYLEEGKTVNLRPLFRNTTAPWIVALVQASARDGFRYYILSKTPLDPMRDILNSIPLTPKQVNVNGKANHSFECAFWNNGKLKKRKRCFIFKVYYFNNSILTYLLSQYFYVNVI